MQRRSLLKNITLSGAGLIFLPDFFSQLSAQTVIDTNGYVGKVKNGILDWLETIRFKKDGWGRWKYNSHMVRDYGLVPSCHGITIYNQLDAITSLSMKTQRINYVFGKLF
ncbi:MAG: hypothetical protein HC830_05975 [Bacteroidetes bacterium]|nr:hypothetical protein [Bacteroidota bacterium]